MDSHVPLKEYVDRRLDDISKAADDRFASQEKNITTALQSVNERLGGVNEFRDQMRDMISTLMPRAEYTAQHKAIDDKINAVVDRMNRSEGRGSGIGIAWQVIVPILTVGAAVVLAIIFKHG